MSRSATSTKRADRAARREPARGGPGAATLKWPAILGGLVVAYIASVAMGVLMARAGVAGVLALFPFVQFGALFAGGYVAGRWATAGGALGTDSAAPKGSGFFNGVAVAVAFIAVWSAQNVLQEAQLVETYGPLALPRMNIPGIVLGDFLNLSAAAVGGWLADRKRG